MLGPETSASRTPTRAPSAASARARLTAVVDLPTPPFPEPMAMMLRTRGSGLRLGCTAWAGMRGIADVLGFGEAWEKRSEEHTSELQSLMRISYAVFCLKKEIKTR